MLLETLLLSPCFLSGKTSHKDSQTKIYIHRSLLADDEVLLFFDIDDQTDHYCDIRDGNSHRRKLRELFWEKREGHRLCDFLVFYAKGSKRVFCFVELKDDKSAFLDAKDQVISTCSAFKDKLANEFKKNYIVEAFICFSKGTLPKEYKVALDELNKMFIAYEHDGKPENFLNFLRGEDVKFNKRGQKKK